MNNFLIFKLFSIGDVLLTTPLIKALKEKHPNCNITYAVGEYSKPVIINNPNIDKIISINDEYIIKKNIFEILKFVLKLRKEKYNYIFLLHRAKEINILSLFLRGKKIYISSVDKKNIHERLKYLELLKEIAIPYSSAAPEIFLKDDEIKYASDILKNYKTPFVTITPGGGKNPKTFYPQKRWQIKNYIELTKLILENTSANIVLLGDKSEISLSEKISSISENRILNLTGKCNILQTSAIIKYCSLFIGCDSGLMHLASALEVPVIALFGPTDENVWGPVGENNIVIRKKISCSPCYKNDGNFYYCKDNICMKEIKVQEVYKEVEKWLKVH